MHLVAETYWTPEFAVGALCRRTDARVIPYSKFLHLHQVIRLTGMSLPDILSGRFFHILTLPDEMAMVHPDLVVKYATNEVANDLDGLTDSAGAVGLTGKQETRLVKKISRLRRVG